MNRFAVRLCSTLILCGLTSLAAAQKLHKYQVGPQPNGSVVVTTNEVLTPAGQQVNFSGRPLAIAIRPDQKTAAVLNTGGDGVVEVIDLTTATVKQEFNTGDYSVSYDGILYSADGTRLYIVQDDGQVSIASVAADGTLALTAQVSIPQPGGTVNPSAVALSNDGSKLFVVLNMANALGVIDLASNRFTGQIPVGNAPHSVAVFGNVAYVSNQGGRPARPREFTVFSAGTPIVADHNSGAAITGTVSVVDVSSGTLLKSIAVGLHPTAILASQDYVFVANSNSDSISVIDTVTNTVVQTVPIQAFANAPFGSSPNGLAVTPGGELLVTLGTSNAVAFFNVKGLPNQVHYDGLVPTGWYPTGIQYASAANQLIVSNEKGAGVGTNVPPTATVGPDPATNKTGRNVYEYIGSVSQINYPTAKQLRQYTAQVARNNGWNQIGKGEEALPAVFNQPSPIQHVFYVIKENRTYDQMLGDDARGNGDPKMNQFPLVDNPNQHALADDFVLLDNFYSSGILSADGHQWADQAFAPDYLEKSFDDFQRSYPYNGGDSLAYTPTGFLWENATKHGKTVRMYGEYAYQYNGPWEEYGDWSDWYNDSLILEGKEQGTLHVPLGVFRANSDVPSVDKLLNRDYPPFDTGIPDQYRLDVFLKDFNRFVKSKNLPNLIVMTLCTDHTSGVSSGYPTPASQVADNDLAVGRLVDAISHSPYWASSAIFIVEDDSQDGVDHVDGHRAPAFVISPYVQRKLVDSTYYTQLDVVRSIEDILGLPTMTQMDLIAPPMSDLFTDTPDLTPYTALPNQIPLDTLVSNTDQSPMAKAWIAASSRMFPSGPGKKPDSADPNLLNHAIWYGTKGFNTPYPGDSKVLRPEEVQTAPSSKRDGDDD